eukprot:scaffold693_cov200-Alexandrium_tamarense.AAC.45
MTRWAREGFAQYLSKRTGKGLSIDKHMTTPGQNFTVQIRGERNREIKQLRGERKQTQLRACRRRCRATQSSGLLRLHHSSHAPRTALIPIK